MLLGAVIATILILDNTAQVSHKAISQLSITQIILQIALDTSYWTMFNHIMIWGSLLWYFTLDSFYNYIFGGPYVGALAKAITGKMMPLSEPVLFANVESTYEHPLQSCSQ